MDMRDYDPATARWTGVDPITHFSQSPYNAFDSNPVFWADPSGAELLLVFPIIFITKVYQVVKHGKLLAFTQLEKLQNITLEKYQELKV
jgi:hypothetical protein